MNEYKVLRIAPTGEDLEKNLNNFAKDGWKPILLSHSHPASAVAPAEVVVIFERPKRSGERRTQK